MNLIAIKDEVIKTSITPRKPHESYEDLRVGGIDVG